MAKVEFKSDGHGIEIFVDDVKVNGILESREQHIGDEQYVWLKIKADEIVCTVNGVRTDLKIPKRTKTDI